jgi:hypothetical protein
MSFENEYKRFAAASLDLTERATDLSHKVGLLIVAEAWLDLAEQTTQLVDHKADEAHEIMEQPLISATFPRQQPVAD